MTYTHWCPSARSGRNASRRPPPGCRIVDPGWRAGSGRRRHTAAARRTAYGEYQPKIPAAGATMNAKTAETLTIWTRSLGGPMELHRATFFAVRGNLAFDGCEVERVSAHDG